MASKLHPNGEPFSDRSARFVGDSIAKIVTVAVWSVLEINLLRRIKKNLKLPIEERDGTNDRFIDR